MGGTDKCCQQHLLDCNQHDQVASYVRDGGLGYLSQLITESDNIYELNCFTE